MGVRFETRKLHRLPFRVYVYGTFSADSNPLFNWLPLASRQALFRNSGVSLLGGVLRRPTGMDPGGHLRGVETPRQEGLLFRRARRQSHSVHYRTRFEIEPTTERSAPELFRLPVRGSRGKRVSQCFSGFLIP